MCVWVVVLSLILPPDGNQGCNMVGVISVFCSVLETVSWYEDHVQMIEPKEDLKEAINKEETYLTNGLQ